MKSPAGKKKLPPRKKPMPKKQTAWTPPESKQWVDQKHTPQQKVKDYIGGFLCMFEASMREDSKFEPNETIASWWVHTGLRTDIPEIGLTHAFLIVYSNLFSKACRINNIRLMDSYIKINNTIMSEKFYSYSNSRVSSLFCRLQSVIYSHLK